MPPLRARAPDAGHGAHALEEDAGFAHELPHERAALGGGVGAAHFAEVAGNHVVEEVAELCAERGGPQGTQWRARKLRGGAAGPSPRVAIPLAPG